MQGTSPNPGATPRGAPELLLSPRDRRVLARLPRLWLPMVALLVALPWLVHSRDARRDQALFVQRGADVVRLHVQLIEQELEASTATLVHLAGQAGLREALGSGSPDSRPSAEVREDYASLTALHGYVARLFALDPEGRVVVDSQRGEPFGPLPDVRAAAEGLARGEVAMSDVVGGGRPGELVVRLSTPVVAGSGARLGTLVLEHATAAMAERLQDASEGLPGWCFLVDGAGRYLVDPLGKGRGRADDADTPAFVEDHAGAWELVRSHAQGQLLDETGQVTFQSVPSAPGPRPPVVRSGLSTTLVYFVPRRVVFEESRRTLKRLALVCGVLALLSLALAWRLAHAEAVRAASRAVLETSAARLRELARRLLVVQEEERRAVARDLHDELGQVATAVVIDLKRAEKSEDAAQRAELIGRARTGVEQLLGSMRELLSRLRASAVEDLGLAGALDALFRELEGAYGVRVDAELRLAVEPPPAAALVAYRVVQEALTNVARHAGVESVRVRVTAAEDELEVEVRDRGAGFDPRTEPSGRLGLLGMRERVELSGGKLVIDSPPGAGTRVWACLPLAGGEGRT